jgi:hypothetical protein
MILKVFLEGILDKYKITADQVVIIEAIFQKEFIFLEKILEIDKQRRLLLQNLVRRGYLGLFNDELGFDISENLYVTDLGEDIIASLRDRFESFKREDINFTKTNFEQLFQEFWETFPTSDKVLHYPRTRVLRTEQEKCKKLYKKLLEDYTHDEIIKALKYEINMRLANSTGKMFSDFKFMKASITWLNNKEFLAILDIMKDDNIEKVDTWTTDV